MHPVPVVVGPVATSSARVWLASAARTLDVVRHRPDLQVPAPVMAAFQAYVDEWSGQLAGDEFLWAGEIDGEVLESVAANWARLVTLAREEPDATGLAVAPPEGEAFFDALAAAILDALARLEDGDAFAARFDEVVPEFTDGARRAVVAEEHERTVLLVDDNADIRLLLRIGLETTGGFRIVGEAGNGQEAVDAIGAGCPDAILLDVSMPVMDGLTALPLLKGRCAETRVVVFSADDTPSVRAEVAQHGGFRFLRKDAPITEISEVLRTP